MFLSEIKSSEVEQITSHLKANKSHGHDEIHPKVIKEVGYKISTVLCHIFNQSFKTGIIPNELKISLITPILKNGKNDEFDNYRPISVLSCFSKILEKLMYKRLIDYIEKNNILHANQYGFRNNRSTTMAITHLIEKIRKAIEINEYTIILEYF
jgi:hypothetical protein